MLCSIVPVQVMVFFMPQGLSVSAGGQLPGLKGLCHPTQLVLHSFILEPPLLQTRRHAIECAHTIVMTLNETLKVLPRLTPRHTTPPRALFLPAAAAAT